MKSCALDLNQETVKTDSLLITHIPKIDLVTFFNVHSFYLQGPLQTYVNVNIMIIYPNRRLIMLYALIKTKTPKS